MVNTIYNPETARDNPGTLTRYRVSTPATAEVFFFGSLDEVKAKAVRRLHIIDPLWVPVKEER